MRGQVSCGFTILNGLISIGLLLSSSPVQKIADHVGEFTAQPFGSDAVNVVDLTGIRAVTAAFPLLIIPPDRLTRAGFRPILCSVKGFSRQWNHYRVPVIIAWVVRGVVVGVHGVPPPTREPAHRREVAGAVAVTGQPSISQTRQPVVTSIPLTPPAWRVRDQGAWPRRHARFQAGRRQRCATRAASTPRLP
ncbi:hypothetical protein [Kibdelosporangium philippinense]|uniref:hypothetical protein n=1 Tax=Kibdelosporangium philippinense TaxID=211113 RepID=UPI0036232C7C